jgi:hypothetical protein
MLGAFVYARASAWLRLPGDHLFGGGLSSHKRQFDPVGETLKPFATGPSRAHSRDEENGMAKTKKSTSNRKSKRNRPAQLKPQDWTLGLSVVNPKAAGIDIGNEDHWVAVPPSLDPEPVRRFSCFTGDLIALADWLQSLGIETVAIAYASHCTSVGR